MTLSDLKKVLTAKEEREIDFSWGEGWVGIKGLRWALRIGQDLEMEFWCGGWPVGPSVWNRVNPACGTE